jgi:hypothetical protein
MHLLQAANEAAPEAPPPDTSTSAIGDAFTTYGPWGLGIVALAVVLWWFKRKKG